MTAVLPSQPSTGHTPTPWTSRLYDFSCVIHGPRKIQVVSTSWHGSIRASYPLKSESLANIELIVEAVNSHASLKARIEALEGALGRIVRGGIDVLLVAALEDDPINPDVLRQIVNDAGAALSSQEAGK